MSDQEKDCSLGGAEFLRGIIRWHKFRPWAATSSEGGEFAYRCGDCGAALAPTVATLQDSACDLLDRMIAA
jgi:hypothetical protein